MENLAPALECALEIQASIAAGETVREGINKFARDFPGDLSQRLQSFLFQIDQNRGEQFLVELAHTPLQRSLFQLILRSCRGESVGPPLADLTAEMQLASQAQMEEFVQTLPVRMMIPVLLFQFPAFLTLLIGPLLIEFMRSFR